MIGTATRQHTVRPQFKAALAPARQIRAHALALPGDLHGVRDERPGRDAAALTAPADHLTGHGLVREMLAGSFPGIYGPNGPECLLFAFLPR